MNPEQARLLSLLLLPARLTVEQAAWYLGFQAHEIPILIAAKLLKPLGRPPASGVKYLSLKELEQLRSDERWLDRASDTIVKYWRDKNSRRKKGGLDRGPAEVA